jgi:hypothetical protein
LASPIDGTLRPALNGRLRDFPFEAAANPFEQISVVKPQHRLARFRVNSDPATLNARGLRNFNLAHVITH